MGAVAGRQPAAAPHRRPERPGLTQRFPVSRARLVAPAGQRVRRPGAGHSRWETGRLTALPAGAGQDVGRSCILVSIGGKNVMLDCGMHMGFNDDRRFPDFSYITRSGRLTDFLDCVIISHFHLDHCGALPYFSEMVGYDGPIYMTHPTQAICPILLEDYRKIAVDKKGEANFFTSQMIKDCMKKVVAVHLHQTVQVRAPGAPEPAGTTQASWAQHWPGHVGCRPPRAPGRPELGGGSRAASRERTPGTCCPEQPVAPGRRPGAGVQGRAEPSGQW
ncbi:PREDICTED: integrator complex subunit 11 [Condylura cristata]|uniref:integrator complex subunit 11 n=1 Tax=Condylura cristata TaxID=143302 RepID=UPI000334589F|nr:PREDICTED: integrator complex subunit 11 [Condylura cristata]